MTGSTSSTLIFGIARFGCNCEEGLFPKITFPFAAYHEQKGLMSLICLDDGRHGQYQKWTPPKHKAGATGVTYKTRLGPLPANGWVPPPLPPNEEVTEPPSGSGGAKAKSGKRRPRGSDVDPKSFTPPLPFD